MGIEPEGESLANKEAKIGIEVIFICREDALQNVHFDTRQYNHIVWETPEELRQGLAARISAVIGDGSRRVTLAKIDSFFHPKCGAYCRDHPKLRIIAK